MDTAVCSTKLPLLSKYVRRHLESFPATLSGWQPPVHSLLVDDVRVGKAQGAWYHTYANAPLRFLSKAQEVRVYLRRREGCIDRGRIAPYGSNGRVQSLRNGRSKDNAPGLLECHDRCQPNQNNVRRGQRQATRPSSKESGALNS